MRFFLTLNISLFFFVFSCTSTKRLNDNAHEKSTQKVEKELVYQKSQDYHQFSGEMNKGYGESFALTTDLKNLKADNELTEIFLMCYQGSFDEAFKIVDSLLVRYRAMPSYWHAIATCYDLKGERRKAILYYNKVREIDSNYSPALNNLAIMLGSGSENSKSLQSLKQVKNKISTLNQITLYQNFQLMKELRTHLSLISDDLDQVAPVKAYYHLYNGDYSLALNFYEKNLALTRSNDYSWMNYLLVLKKVGANEKYSEEIKKIKDSVTSQEKRAYLLRIEELAK